MHASLLILCVQVMSCTCCKFKKAAQCPNYNMRKDKHFLTSVSPSEFQTNCSGRSKAAMCVTNADCHVHVRAQFDEIAGTFKAVCTDIINGNVNYLCTEIEEGDDFKYCFKDFIDFVGLNCAPLLNSVIQCWPSPVSIDVFFCQFDAIEMMNFVLEKFKEYSVSIYRCTFLSIPCEMRLCENARNNQTYFVLPGDTFELSVCLETYLPVNASLVFSGKNFTDGENRDHNVKISLINEYRFTQMKITITNMTESNFDSYSEILLPQLESCEPLTFTFKLRKKSVISEKYPQTNHIWLAVLSVASAFVLVGLTVAIIAYRRSYLPCQASKCAVITIENETEERTPPLEDHYDYLMDITETPVDFIEVMESHHSVEVIDSNDSVQDAEVVTPYDVPTNLLDEHPYNKIKSSGQITPVGIFNDAMDGNTSGEQTTQVDIEREHGFTAYNEKERMDTAAIEFFEGVIKTAPTDCVNALGTSKEKPVGIIQDISSLNPLQCNETDHDGLRECSNAHKKCVENDGYITPDDTLPLPHETALSKLIANNPLLNDSCKVLDLDPMILEETYNGAISYDYWAPDGSETNFTDAAIGMGKKKGWPRSTVTDADYESSYWIADGAHYGTNDLYNYNADTCSSHTYVRLSDYVAGPFKKGISFHDTMSQVDALRLNMFSAHESKEEGSRNDSEGQCSHVSPPRRTLSEIVSPLLRASFNVSDPPNYEYDMLVNVSDIHVYGKLADVSASHKLYDVNKNKPRSYPDDTKNLGMGNMVMCIERNDVIVNHVSFVQFSDKHEKSDRVGYHGYRLQEEADVDIYRSNHNDDSLLEVSDLKSVDDVDIPQACNFKSLARDTEAVLAPNNGARNREEAIDLKVEDEYWIPDGADLSHEEKVSSEIIAVNTIVCREDGEALFKRHHPVDEHGYSQPIEF